MEIGSIRNATDKDAEIRYYTIHKNKISIVVDGINYTGDEISGGSIRMKASQKTKAFGITMIGKIAFEY